MPATSDSRLPPLSVRLNATRRKQIDRAAKRLGMTRNAYITHALDKENARVLRMGMPRSR